MATNLINDLSSECEIDILDFQADTLERPGTGLLVGGFGASKSFSLALTTITWAERYKEHAGLILSEDYPTLNQSLMPHITNLLTFMGVRHKAKINDKCLYIWWGAKRNGREVPTLVYWTYYSDPDKIVGTNVAWAVLDEIDRTRYPYTVWKNVLARVRINTFDGTGQKIRLATTPEGHGFSYHVFNPKGNRYNKDNNFWYVTIDSRQNPYLDESMLVSILRNYTPAERVAYVKGLWVILNGFKVFDQFSEKNIVKISNLSPTRPEVKNLIVGLDFNRAKMVATFFIKRLNKFLETQYICIDELVLTKRASTQEMISEMRKRYPHSTFDIYPDASSQNSSTASGDWTDFAQLVEAFGEDRVHAMTKNPSVESRWAVCNRMFYRGALLIAEHCTNVLADMEGVVRDEVTGLVDKKRLEANGLVHASDSMTYPMFTLNADIYDARYTDKKPIAVM